MSEQVESPTYIITVVGRDGDGVITVCWTMEGDVTRTWIGTCYWWEAP